MQPARLAPAVRGSALITVVFLTAMFAMLTASMLNYTLTEKRGNERNRVQLRAKNMAENISLYAAEQLTTKLYRTRATSAMAFIGGSNQIHLPDSSGNNSVLSNVNYATVSGMEVYAGMLAPTAYALVTDTTDSNYGLQVSTATVPVIAKATVTHPQIGAQTAHVLQEMEIAMTPMFQFGLFYNMDLELFPGQTMTIMGPVHTNGRLMARGEVGGTAVLTFSDRVSAAAGLYADGQMKVAYRNRSGGNTAGAGGSGAVNYTRINGSTLNLYSGSIWRDHKWGGASETATTLNNFKSFATTNYGTNVRTNVHGVTKLELPGVGTYSETDLTTTSEDDRNNGRQIIEPPNPKKWRLSGGTYQWVNTTDTADERETKISWKAGLYIAANPDDTVRSTNLPDGSVAYVLPHSYRAWAHTIDSSNVHACTEVVLPGQPSYGYNRGPDSTVGTDDDYNYPNYFPNRYTEQTTVGSNQVLDMAQQGFARGSGYLVNGAHAIGATSITVNTGTGPIVAGDVITIGTFRYLVTGALSGGTVTIGQPGLRAAAASGATVAVEMPRQVGNATGMIFNSSAAIGATSLDIRGTTGTVFPGNSVTIGTFRYLVTAAPVTPPASAATPFTLGIAQPGLRAAAVITPTATTVAIDTTSCTLGTGIGYQINNAAGYAVGATNLNVDTGAGTIIPGNFIAIGGNRCLVSSVSTTLTSAAVSLVSGLTEAAADDALLIVDPFPYTGYRHAAHTIPAFPAESSTAPYPTDAYFFDSRRANGNQGYVSNVAGGSARSTTNYIPRAISKIDFDMGRFKMMVARAVSGATSATGYKLQQPDATVWTNSIFNSAGATTTLDLGLDDPAVAGLAYTVLPPASGGSLTERTRPDPFAVYTAPATPEAAATVAAIFDDPRTFLTPSGTLYDGVIPDAFFDGLAVYIHSIDAEERAQAGGVPTRVDSGVRLVNGRGAVASLTAANKTGFTLATNDSAYILGHFNADGSVNLTTTSTGNGGYSARYPDSANEKLCAVMADAVTLLSQPVYTSATTPYSQTNGWNDALSAFRITNTTWTNTWRSAAPSSSNNYEGLGTSATAIRPGVLPTSSTPGTAGSTWQTKLPPPQSTEYSAALLVGIVPSNHDATNLTDRPAYSGANGQYSGGAHNFPRMIEDWHSDLDAGVSGNANLVIRGSMVALFESRVALEPWNIRTYAAPNRYWGLHEGFRTAGHDVPLEPIVLSSTRKRYLEQTAAEYAAMKTTIEALPH